jgi:hypothetical protein
VDDHIEAAFLADDGRDGGVDAGLVADIQLQGPEIETAVGRVLGEAGNR